MLHVPVVQQAYLITVLPAPPLCFWLITSNAWLIAQVNIIRILLIKFANPAKPLAKSAAAGLLISVPIA